MANFPLKFSVLKFQQYFFYCNIIHASYLFTIEQKFQIISSLLILPGSFLILFGTEIMLASDFLDLDGICNQKTF